MRITQSDHDYYNLPGRLMPPEFHKLLERQIKKYLPDEGISKDYLPLFSAISASYYHNDRDRELLERAMEISSVELKEANQQIREELSGKLAALQKVRRNEKILQNINRNLTEAIFRLSARGKLLFANQSFLELFGYSSIREILRLESEDIYVNPQDAEKFLELMPKKKIVKGMEVNLKKKDGTRFWGLINAIVNEDEEAYYFDGSIIDISAQKNTQDMLRQANQMLLKTNSELDKFLYSASHDLRAPLLSLLGLIGVMELDKPDNINVYLIRMRSSILKLDTFIQEIVDFTHNLRTENVETNINFYDLIDESFQQLESFPLARPVKKVSELLIESDFYCDIRRLKVIINNLLMNAAIYHNEKTEQPFIKISIESKTDYCRIDVSDNGIGIPDESKDKVFDMFYRGNESAKGAGLGLYIVKEIVQKLNGQIVLNSVQGKGTTFTIILPNKVVRHHLA